MAKLHNSIQRNVDQRGINDLFDMGEQDGVVRLSESLVVNRDVYSGTDSADAFILRDDVLFSFFAFVGATAAEFSIVGVGLPVQSPQLLVIDGATGRGATTLQLGMATRAAVAATLTGGNNAICRDQRYASLPNVTRTVPLIETWQGTDPGLLGSFQEEINALTQDYRSFLSMPYIVRPGGVLVISGGTVNVAVGVNIWGHVRRALNTEVNG